MARPARFLEHGEARAERRREDTHSVDVLQRMPCRACVVAGRATSLRLVEAEPALRQMNDDTLALLEQSLEAGLRQWRYRSFFPDSGPLRRALYPRHMAFFRATKIHREVAFIAANRIGKTVAGAYATTVHATGRYPDWWEGRVFDWAGQWLAAGTTLETTRDIVQAELFGHGEEYGTGMIPAADIDDIKRRPNTNGAIDFAMIKRQGGGYTRLSLKSYDQGRKAFEGTARQGVWMDEEPKMDIYTECLTRTATTDGILQSTFTPLNGATDVVMSFIENAEMVI